MFGHVGNCETDRVNDNERNRADWGFATIVPNAD